MKKAIALAVAMAAATGAHAEFETDVGFGENGLNDFIFTAWTNTADQDVSVNVDLNLNPVNDAGTGFRDLTAESRTWEIDLSPITDAGLDMSTLRWTVFGNNAAGIGHGNPDGRGGLEIYYSVSNVTDRPSAAFNSQYVAFINFMNANQGPDAVTSAEEGSAAFGGEVNYVTFDATGPAGEIGETMTFAAYDQQTGVPKVLNNITFDGTTLSMQPVPVPAAAWLFGSALVGLAGIARRRQA